MTLPEPLVQVVLRTESNPVRFERFCNDLLSVIFGRVFVPTSRTWDGGRDGRTVDLGVPLSLSASIEQNARAKMLKEVPKVKKHTSAEAVYFCSNQALSTQAIDELKAELAEALPRFTIEILSRDEIAALAADKEDLLRQYYASELADIVHVREGLDSIPKEPELRALRLALVASTGDDAIMLRHDLLCALILEELKASGKPLTPATLGQRLAAALRLPHAPNSGWIGESIERLRQQGFIEIAGATVAISALGRDQLRALRDRAAGEVSEGKSLVHDELEGLAGVKIDASQFFTAWKDFEAALAFAFYQRGIEVICGVSSLLDDASGREDKPEYRIVREGLADRFAAHFTGGPVRETIRQAVIDLFSSPASPAFEWLTEVSARFVAICSLGLEQASSKKVAEVVRGVAITIDSDIALSLLCSEEPNHAAVVSLVTAWSNFGGRLWIAAPVLEECAYHAWIAEFEIAATARLFKKLASTDADRLLQNAFVRTFWYMTGGRFSVRNWASYIKTFIGRDEYDYSQVAKALRDDFRVEVLNSPAELSSLVAERQPEMLRTFVAWSKTEGKAKRRFELGKQTIDKCKRDAELLCLIAHYRQSPDHPSLANLSLVTSSRRLMRAGRVYDKMLGEPEAVMPLASVSTLLAIAPGTGIDLRALRAVLFDTSYARRLQPAQRQAIRVLKAVLDTDLPWAKRGQLQRQLRVRVEADARKGSRSRQELWKELGSRNRTAYQDKTFGRVFERLAILPRPDRLLREAMSENEKLHARIAQLESEAGEKEPT